MDMLARHVFRPLRGRFAWALALALLCRAGPASGLDLSILELTSLDFGAVIDRSGEVIMGLNDAVTWNPDGIHVSSSPTTTGRFQITGDPFAVFSLSIIGSVDAGLRIDDFVTSEGVPPLLAVVLDGTGHIDISVGATLTVDENTAAPGLDQALAYTISINYN